MNKSPRNLLSIILRLPASVLIGLVHVYQRTLSPDHGPLKHAFRYGYCRHEPTCSQYAMEVLQNKPLLTALWLIARRIVGCNPWTKPTDKKLQSVISRL